MTSLPPLRQRILYGRRRDKAVLRGRIESAGLTVVTGRPRAGKSWLLERMAYDLWQDAQAEVGYYDCTTNADEALRESLVNLLERLIAEAHFSKRLELLITDSRTAHPVSKVFEGLMQAVQGFSGVISAPGVGGVAALLAGLSKKLRGEGLVGQRQPLEYNWARDTVRLIYETNMAYNNAQKPIVLFLDGWERSREIDASANLLRGFLDHLEDWDGCHIIVGCRDPEEDHCQSTTEKANQLLDSLVSQFVEASSHRLNLIELDDDESRKLLISIREWYPELSDVDDAWILEQIGGCPGVIGDWAKWSRSREKPDTVTQAWLAEIAANARQNLYPELANLAKLEDETQRTAAFRCAFLPDLHQSPELRKVAFDGVDEGKVIDALVDQGIFEPPAQADAPPLLGHETRRQAARQAFLGGQGTSPSRWTGRAMDALAMLLASEIRAIEGDYFAFSAALLALESHAATITSSEPTRLIFAANLTLFGRDGARAFASAFDPRQFRAMVTGLDPRCGALLARGLFNAIGKAETEVRREGLLGALRQLQQAYPDDAAMRERLASGLFNAFHAAETEARRDALLDALRHLQRAYPDDAAVRERLAMGLVNASHAAEKEARREGLLGELGQLQQAYPDDAAVRESLAMGLFNATGKTEARRDALLDALRHLQQAYPDDAAVRERLASGLFNAFRAAETEARRDALLDALRQLQQAYPGDAALRERLARGLFIATERAETEARREELKEILLAFLATCSEDPWIPGFLKQLGD